MRNTIPAPVHTLLLSTLLFIGCGSETSPYDGLLREAISYTSLNSRYNQTFDHKMVSELVGYSRVGAVRGESDFFWKYDDGWNLGVSYTALQYKETEVYPIKNVTLRDDCAFTDCSNYHPVSLSANWRDEDYATFYVSFPLDGRSIRLSVFGSTWSSGQDFIVFDTSRLVKEFKQCLEDVNYCDSITGEGIKKDFATISLNAPEWCLENDSSRWWCDPNHDFWLDPAKFADL